MQRIFLQKTKAQACSGGKTLSLANNFIRKQQQYFSNKQQSSGQQVKEAQAVSYQNTISNQYQHQPIIQSQSRLMLGYMMRLRSQMQYLNNKIGFTRLSMQKNDDKSDTDKVPKGFERFFRKKPEKSASNVEETKKEQKKSEEKKEEEALTEEEDGEHGRQTKDSKDKKKAEEQSSQDNPLKNFFFQPNGGPIWDNWLVAALLAGCVYFYMSGKTPSQEVTYMDFVNQYLSKNQVKMITITEDKASDMFKYRAEVETLDGKKVHLVLPQVENFLYKLDLAQREMGRSPNEFVPVKYASEASKQQANPMLNVMIGGLFIIFMLQIYRSMHSGKGGPKGMGGKAGGKDQGAGGFGGKSGGGFGDFFNMGKSNVQIYGVDKKIKTRFKHVAGMENAKQEVTEFVDFLKNPKKYQKLGAQIPRGALLVGPPGTGKTLLAKAVAGEAGVPFLSISGSDFVEMFVGVGASRVRDLFKKAREKAPSIIFIDEIDAVAKKRHGKFGGNDERDNTLNQLLVEMDGFGTEESVIVLAATNRADILDSALLRPGRFDRQIEITSPTIKDRTEIFKVHLKKIKLNIEKSREEYAKKLATLTPGFSGADISNVCNEGAIIAARTNLESVGIQQFEQAVERVIGGIEKKTVMTPEEKKTIAYHESGHAVAGWFLENSNPLLKITIIPRSKGSLGFAQYLPDEISLYTKEKILDMICTALAGRVTEEIMFGKITTGAQDDIKKVTQYAQGLVTIYGMSPKMGLVGYGSVGEESMTKPFSDDTNAEIDEEVRKIVMECYARTTELIQSKKHLIEALAEELLKKESIGLPDIIKILGERPFPMKESIKEYLQEMQEREEKEKEKAAETVANENTDDVDHEDKDKGKGKEIKEELQQALDKTAADPSPEEVEKKK